MPEIHSDHGHARLSLRLPERSQPASPLPLGSRRTAPLALLADCGMRLREEATPRQPLPSKATFREGCMCAKYRFLSLLLVTLFLLFFSPILANAECASPDNPGVRICSPTGNAAVVYVPGTD